MNNKKANRFRAVLLILFFYILAQLAWWAFLITKLTADVYEGDPRMDHRIAMVWGEGIVFASLLLAGFILTYRSYSKELKLAKQQRNFLMSVTHEFKTPIASLSLSLQTLQSRKLDENKFQDLIHHALQDTQRLNSLAENMLLATRIDQNLFPVHKMPLNISDLLKNTINSLLALESNHRFELHIEENIQMNADAFMIQSVWSNLIENAMKYSPSNSIIAIVLKHKEKEILFQISDQGDGILPEDTKRIFQKFVRLGNEDTRKTKGTGLGLYLVDYFVKQHQGNISVLPNQPKGTKFLVQFPIS